MLINLFSIVQQSCANGDLMNIKEFPSMFFNEKIKPKELMKCILGLRSNEVEAYAVLLKFNSTTVEEFAKKINRDRSTAQKLLQDLVAKGLAIRVETPIKKGGRIYEYSPIPLELVKKRMREVFEEWCKKAIKVLDEFPNDFEKH